MGSPRQSMNVPRIPPSTRWWKDGIHPLLIKIEELRISHFSGSHHEFPMVAPRHVPPDRDIEGFIREDHARDICSHEPSDDGGIGGVSADQEMGAKQEQVVYPSAGTEVPVTPQARSQAAPGPSRRAGRCG